jgi:hypothetical protein
MGARDMGCVLESRCGLVSPARGLDNSSGSSTPRRGEVASGASLLSV